MEKYPEIIHVAGDQPMPLLFAILAITRIILPTPNIPLTMGILSDDLLCHLPARILL